MSEKDRSQGKEPEAQERQEPGLRPQSPRGLDRVSVPGADVQNSGPWATDAARGMGRKLGRLRPQQGSGGLEGPDSTVIKQ